jgi:hypothetical protein
MPNASTLLRVGAGFPDSRSIGDKSVEFFR